MKDIATLSTTKYILDKYNLNALKKYGQNFLIDENVLHKIVDAAAPWETGCALEIGPGAGTLTRCLAAHAKHTAAIEIDRALIPILEETMAPYPDFTLIHQDVMTVDLKALTHELFGDAPFCVAANLPYYITTPIIMELLESRLPVTTMTLMVQKEVADRMTAAPGGKEYGALSVAVQYYAKPSLICKAEPHCFLPQPKVASSVIKLEVLPEPSVRVSDEKLFFKVVKSAFGQRRKTLLNALTKSPYLQTEKERILAALSSMGLSADIRGERLTVAQFAELTGYLA